MNKPAAILSMILLSAATALPSLADGATHKRPTAPVDEYALKKLPQTGTPIANPRDTVMYSDTLVGTPTWTRPFADCTGATGLGPMGYQVEPFYVSANGAYDVTSVQNGWDGYIFVYQNSFNPASPNTNCVIGNDDGGGGIGTSEIFGVALSAGVQYFVVTTAFENGEEGTFTNTITGPGTITLGALGGSVDLSITKTGTVPASGNFDYTLTAGNAGPDAASGVIVTDVLPAGVTFVSSSCGGSIAGQTFTWNIGGLAAGGSVTCVLTVSVTSCQAVTNTATISSTNLDTNSANNSSTASNATEGVADGSFEGGTPNADWTEASSNFGTPLCTVADCGTGTGTGPRTGEWWAWFGGIAAPEVGSMTQSVTIAEGSTLTFWYEFPVCANGTDFVRLQIDGNTLWEANGTHPDCNSVGYNQQTVDISAFDDGGVHTLVFTSTISGSPSGSNFFIDDVSISAATCGGGGGGGQFETTFDVAVPTVSEIGLMAMALLMAASAFVVLRKR